MNTCPTLHQAANEKMIECIKAFIRLNKATGYFSDVRPEHLVDTCSTVILLEGFGIESFDMSADNAIEEWKLKRGTSFNTEKAITHQVYLRIRELGAQYLDDIEKETSNFTKFTAEFIHANPHFLPLFQHIAGISSKAELKKLIGSGSDELISKPAAEKLHKIIEEKINSNSLDTKDKILGNLEKRLEGIVRDLVGRVFLESIVENALHDCQIPFKREKEYSHIKGFLYNGRADFVLPDDNAPRVYIEVRKSSDRHAALYAKDRMLSAIDWKGQNSNLMAVLVYDGDWTKPSLDATKKVFDYVVPIAKITELMDTIRAYLDGDESKLRWLIELKISPANKPDNL